MSIRDTHSAEPELIEIRKYANRRLYDTFASRYVTLSDVEQMIRQGKEIRVMDAQSGEDLTRSVMLQIICENKTQQELLPVSFLRQVIQASGKTVRKSLKDFLSLGLQAQRELHQQFSHWMRAGINMNPFLNALSPMFEQSTTSSLSRPTPPSPLPGSDKASPPTPTPLAVNDAPAAYSAQTASEDEGPSSAPSPSSSASEPTPNVQSELAALKQQLLFMQQKIDQLGDQAHGSQTVAPQNNNPTRDEKPDKDNR